MALVGGNLDFVRSLIHQQGANAERRARAQINASASRGSTNPTAIADARSRALAEQRAALAERNTAALAQAQRRDQDQERQAAGLGLQLASTLGSTVMSGLGGGGGGGAQTPAPTAPTEQPLGGATLNQRQAVQNRFIPSGPGGSERPQGQRTGEPDDMDPLGPISTILGSFVPMVGGFLGRG